MCKAEDLSVLKNSFHARSRLLTLLVVGLCSGLTLADTEYSYIENTRTMASELNNSKYEAEAARWGLSSSEWARYLDIKKGPRGIWSPRLDPVAMLALGAKTDSEMRYYATLYAHMQDERISAELKVDRYRREAAQKLYVNKPTFEQEILRAAARKRKEGRSSLNMLSVKEETLLPGDRLIYFVSSTLNPIALIKNLMLKIDGLQRASLDIYITDATDDGEIQEWARGVRLNPELIITKKITLNHDNGALAKLSKDKAKSQMFLKRSGVLYRVSEASI